MDLETAVDRLAAAVRAAAAEQGAPNRFYLLDLANEFGGPSPRLAGRVLRRYRASLALALGIPAESLYLENGRRGHEPMSLRIAKAIPDREGRRCPDCGEPGEQRGHQECQFPQDEEPAGLDDVQMLER